MRRDDTTRLGRRVVMLVDNAVDGDSRVQKTARSAADAGWDVTLIGCAHVDAERRWRLGEAEVRVLPLAAARATPPATAPPATAPAVVSRPGGGVPGPEGADVSASGRGAGSRDGSGLRGVSGLWGVSGLRARLVARGGLPLRAARLVRRPVEHAQVRYWRARLRDGAWRRLEPGLWDYERVAGPVVDELRPDLIHAHDFRMLGVAARAVERARAAGRDTKLVWDAHEWLPGARPRRDNARWLPAHLGYVREFAGHADAVVTVSDTLADLLVRDHALPERPTVILNAPVTAASEPSAFEPSAPEPAAFEPADLAAPDLRKRCGLPPDTPLLVYSGAMAVQRGVDTVVEALPLLPGVHLALVVADPAAAYVRQVVARAARHQVADRVHVLPYVPHRQLVAFLATADIGLIPLHHWPNHEIALITKFFEYAHARLPIVVSDVRTMAETVRATGQGEVFRARDTADLARAVRAVLADPARYRAAYEGEDSPLPGWTWEAQAERLDVLYRRLLTPTP
ncbi:glycosyltransferase [Micromonospora marina]|uniref:Glycosyltransferase involved in cell wall bisynthesis n=1 Tax=Micromonospora marina TaxID=307120 RepID=A0A1C5AKL5_9ACTN|nr:glycosyltransferase [Micromonospora marina]SCF45770.1 Glycosyltransferase involved in cell wall bisynthesis [Micromonospora marina]